MLGLHTIFAFYSRSLRSHPTHYLKVNCETNHLVITYKSPFINPYVSKINSYYLYLLVY